MLIKQISVFIENTEGSLARASRTLAAAGIHVVSVSLADTNDYGLMRMIVSDPDAAEAALRKDGFSPRITTVLAVSLPDCFASLTKLTDALGRNGMNIEYMYTLASKRDYTSVVIKVADREKAEQVIAEAGLKTLSEEEAYNW